MVAIEELQVRVSPDARERFVRLDEEIWTAMLRSRPGYLGKEVWLDTDDPGALKLVVRWERFDDWFGIPADLLARTETRFDRAFGRDYTMEVNAYQLRKFAH